MATPTMPPGHQDEATDECALPLVQRLAALLDRDPAAFRRGDELPPGWHMVLFTPLAQQRSLGPDGHPAEADRHAPADLPRRMLGGRRVRFEGALRIGAELRRVTEVISYQEKQGRSGRLAVATLRHAIAEPGSAPAVIEEQDVIYREPATGAPSAAAPEPPRLAPTHSQPFHPDPVLLFRYSAVTFNGHRIHYDQPYATATEGYPGLVVNGGLTALLLLELAKQVAGRPLARLDVRNRRPLFCGRPATLCAAPTQTGWALWAEDDQGRMAVEASAA